jgi:hypothetical protein
MKFSVTHRSLKPSFLVRLDDLAATTESFKNLDTSANLLA